MNKLPIVAIALLLAACAPDACPTCAPVAPPVTPPPGPTFQPPTPFMRAPTSQLPPASAPGEVNPAVTQATIGATICVSGWTAKVRPPVGYTEPIKERLMETAGVPSSRSKDYELDHRVPLEAGGAPSDPRNLWLESYLGPWNAHMKDKLETYARRQVCSGRMTLDAARAMFLAPDWRVEYVKAFGQPRGGGAE